VAHTQAVQVITVPTRQKLLNKLDRADLPERTKRSIGLSVAALCDAYDEDDDPQKVAPMAASFARMLVFLSHPYHRLWKAPAITVAADGAFVAIWQEPSKFRWSLEFHTDGNIDEVYLENELDGKIIQTVRQRHAGEYVHPPIPDREIIL
jgi:hypothetical protein